MKDGNIIKESKLTKAERKKLDDNMFGIPLDRKYPLHDENHLRAAIRIFKQCPEENKQELANNIVRRIDDMNLDLRISKDTDFYDYYKKAKGKLEEGVAYDKEINKVIIKDGPNEVVTHLENYFEASVGEFLSKK